MYSSHVAQNSFSTFPLHKQFSRNVVHVLKEEWMYSTYLLLHEIPQFCYLSSLPYLLAHKCLCNMYSATSTSGKAWCHPFSSLQVLVVLNPITCLEHRFYSMASIKWLLSVSLKFQPAFSGELHTPALVLIVLELFSPPFPYWCMKSGASWLQMAFTISLHFNFYMLIFLLVRQTETLKSHSINELSAI